MAASTPRPGKVKALKSLIGYNKIGFDVLHHHATAIPFGHDLEKLGVVYYKMPNDDSMILHLATSEIFAKELMVELGILNHNDPHLLDARKRFARIVENLFPCLEGADASAHAKARQEIVEKFFSQSIPEVLRWDMVQRQKYENSSRRMTATLQRHFNYGDALETYRAALKETTLGARLGSPVLDEVEGALEHVFDAELLRRFGVDIAPGKYALIRAIEAKYIHHPDPAKSIHVFDEENTELMAALDTAANNLFARYPSLPGEPVLQRL